MKTQVLMKRTLFDSSITQQSKTGFFSANDLISSGNKFRVLNGLPIIKLQDYLNRQATKEFIIELESVTSEKVKVASRGRNGVTWVHPYLFIDLALIISPKLKIEVYNWIYDSLLKYRNDSGDSYNKMTGALWNNCSNKSKFKDSIIQTARLIRNSVGVSDWQTATAEQLELRNKIHENIALLCDILRDNNQAIKHGINKTIGSDFIIFKND